MPFKIPDINEHILKQIKRSKYSEKSLTGLQEQDILNIFYHLYTFDKKGYLILSKNISFWLTKKLKTKPKIKKKPKKAKTKKTKKEKTAKKIVRAKKSVKQMPSVFNSARKSVKKSIRTKLEKSTGKLNSSFKLTQSIKTKQRPSRLRKELKQSKLAGLPSLNGKRVDLIEIYNQSKIPLKQKMSNSVKKRRSKINLSDINKLKSNGVINRKVIDSYITILFNRYNRVDEDALKKYKLRVLALSSYFFDDYTNNLTIEAKDCKNDKIVSLVKQHSVGNVDIKSKYDIVFFPVKIREERIELVLFDFNERTIKTYSPFNLNKNDKENKTGIKDFLVRLAEGSFFTGRRRTIGKSWTVKENVEKYGCEENLSGSHLCFYVYCFFKGVFLPGNDRSVFDGFHKKVLTSLTQLLKTNKRQ